MTVRVRPAGPLDARGIASIVNDTKARTEPVGSRDIADLIGTVPAGSAVHVAEDDAGGLLGCQFIESHSDLPPGCCEIATFIRPGAAGIGAGSALFKATEVAARSLGYAAIVAIVSRDNEAALTYYQSRGFEVCYIRKAAPYRPRVMTRYAL